MLQESIKSHIKRFVCVLGSCSLNTSDDKGRTSATQNGWNNKIQRKIIGMCMALAIQMKLMKNEQFWSLSDRHFGFTDSFTTTVGVIDIKSTVVRCDFPHYRGCSESLSLAVSTNGKRIRQIDAFDAKWPWFESVWNNYLSVFLSFFRNYRYFVDAINELSEQIQLNMQLILVV